VTITANPVHIKSQDPLEEEIRAFVASAGGRTPPAVSAREGRDALELALAITDAIARNRARAPVLSSFTPEHAPAGGRTTP
jgi:predicted dehydrogenase